jgi:hypothetical protein
MLFCFEAVLGLEVHLGKNVWGLMPRKTMKYILTQESSNFGRNYNFLEILHRFLVGIVNGVSTLRIFYILLGYIVNF